MQVDPLCEWSVVQINQLDVSHVLCVRTTAKLDDPASEITYPHFSAFLHTACPSILYPSLSRSLPRLM